MRAFAMGVLLTVLVAMQAAAQPSLKRNDATASRMPPSPDLPDSRRPSDLLRTGQAALVAGHTAEAEDALEMAQTRMLDRSVPLGQTNDPSDNRAVEQISQARQALQAHDRATCLRIIQSAIDSAVAQGL